MRFQLHWVSLIVGGKFTVFALFYLVFEGNFPSRNPQGAYIWRGDLTEGFLRYRFGEEDCKLGDMIIIVPTLLPKIRVFA